MTRQWNRVHGSRSSLAGTKDLITSDDVDVLCVLMPCRLPRARHRAGQARSESLSPGYPLANIRLQLTRDKGGSAATSKIRFALSGWDCWRFERVPMSSRSCLVR